MRHPQSSFTDDALPPGQVWAISSVGSPEIPGLYKVDVTEGPGSGVKILNPQPRSHYRGGWPPQPGFVDPDPAMVRCAEQTLYLRAKELVGDRDPRQREFSIQLKAFDFAGGGSGVGVGVLVALCSSLLQKSINGGLVVAGDLDRSCSSIRDSNLVGSIAQVFDHAGVVRNAVWNGATSVLMPFFGRRVYGLSDDLAAKIAIHYYVDAQDAALKALAI